MNNKTSQSLYASSGKRLVDLAIAIPLTLALAPLMLLVAIVVRLSLGAPILFTQQRPGLHGKIFRIVKFRTMLDRRSADGTPLPDDQRMTSLGSWLRRCSLDELPELFNVLRGEMSLVGPRPLLPEYLERYTAHQARRHEARPGITGWAQTHGRNAVTWERRFKMDVWYVDHVGLALDLRILWRTIRVVLAGRGVAEPGRVTMTPFRGRSGSDGDEDRK